MSGSQGPWDTPPVSHAGGPDDITETVPLAPSAHIGSPQRERRPRAGNLLIGGVTAVVVATAGVIAAVQILPGIKPAADRRSVAIAKPGITSGAATSAPLPSTPAARYKTVATPCNATAWGPLNDLLGLAVAGNARQNLLSGPVTTMTCAVQVGSLGQRGVANIEIDVLSGNSAEFMYNGLRKALRPDYHLAPVRNLGQAAYSYVDQATGPHVAAFDGNLHIIASLATLANSALATTTAKTITALAKVCQQTMDHLRI